MQTDTVCEQQLQGGLTHKVAQIGAGGQQQLPANALPAKQLSADAAQLQTVMAANAIEKRSRSIS